MIELHVTCENEQAAAELAQATIQARLAACANIVGEVRSLYRWKGTVEDERETLMILKTSDEKADAAEAFIAERHAYETPAIIRHHAVDANEDYARWVDEETK